MRTELNIEEWKARAFACADQIRKEIYAYGEQILKTPELGYRETRTAAFTEAEMRKIGLYNVRRVAYTGVAGDLKPETEGERVCVMGELDAVLTPDCPYADPETGAAHTCGHNWQIAQMLGVAKVIKETGLDRELDGNVTFLAVPAEEFVDLEYRENLIREGKIRMKSGKQELIASGFFKDFSCAMMVHSQPNHPEAACFMDCKSLGFATRRVRFIGKAAHAGGAPHEGINALNAASIAIMCVHAMRETFRDEDRVRVHSIITKGGELLNIVPAEVIMETQIRAATPEALRDACFKVERAIRGGAYAVGAEVEISDMGSYAPLSQDAQLNDLFERNALRFLPPEQIFHGRDMVGSTDMGDVTLELPAIQPTFGGYEGGAHSAGFRSVNEDLTVLLPTKILCATVIDLLCNGGSRAREIRESFQTRKKEKDGKDI